MRKTIKEEKIVSIEKIGKEMTFDIEMEAPANNYIANDFIVHNTTGLQKLSKQLGINDFKTLYDATTLYRPGPLHCVVGDTEIKTLYGKKKIKDLDKNDTIFSSGYAIGGNKNKVHKFFENKVKCLHKNGKQSVFEVLDEYGNKIFCTEKHKFFTNKGWKKLEDIETGEKVLVNLKPHGKWKESIIKNIIKAGKKTRYKKNNVPFNKGVPLRIWNPKMAISIIENNPMKNKETVAKWKSKINWDKISEKNKIRAKAFWKDKKRRKKHSKIMKEYYLKHPHPNEKGINISKPQKEIFLVINKKFKDANLEHPIKTKKSKFFADIGIPSLKLDIEFDGDYWHKNPGKRHEPRDTEIEKVGWKILRLTYKNYKDFIKNFEQKISLKNSVGWKKIISKKYIGKKEVFDITTKNRKLPNYIANNFIVHNSGQTADYILRHTKKKEWEFDHELLKPLTKETYGLILYQEQVMKIMHDLGGFSWATSESARKIMTKSKGKKEFEKMRREFIKNAKKNYDISEEETGKIFDVVSTFGSYGFNKSHAIEYSILSYWTAWLKTYYPAEFFTTLLSFEDDENKIQYYIKDANSSGINIKLPDINKSKIGYVAFENKVYAGFDAIKGIGKKTAEKIVKNQPYESFSDFLKKVKPGKAILQSFSVSGCFESFGVSDKIIYDKAEKISKDRKFVKPFFGKTDDSKFEEKKLALLRQEYLSLPQKKPLIDYFENPYKEKIKFEKINDLVFEEFIYGIWIKGVVTFINFKQEGLEGQWTMFDNVLERRYAHMNVSDGSGNILVHLSPEQYTYYKHFLEEGTGFPVLIYGHSIPNFNKIYCDGMIVLEKIDKKNPIINLIEKDYEEKIIELQKENPDCFVNIIKTVSYKVSKNKNAYVRINFFNKKESLMCFKLDSNIFVAGEILVYKVTKSPFIEIQKRIKRSE